jgi:transketolase
MGALGYSVAVLHMHTIKPLDQAALLERMEGVPVIVTLEEHSIVGGLGSAVAEILAEANFNTPKQFKRLGIPDVFPDQYGSQSSLMKRYAITSEALVQTVRSLSASASR